eukprot:m.11430 g.11430  ORF g.11430 m.11430 type:complete len:332 (-) comp7376_c0_seq1:217-1212(-)
MPRHGFRTRFWCTSCYCCLNRCSRSAQGCVSTVVRSTPSLARRFWELDTKHALTPHPLPITGLPWDANVAVGRWGHVAVPVIRRDGIGEGDDAGDDDGVTWAVQVWDPVLQLSDPATPSTSKTVSCSQTRTLPPAVPTGWPGTGVSGTAWSRRHCAGGRPPTPPVYRCDWMSLGTGIDGNAMASAEGAALDRGVRAQYIVSQAVAALATGGGCLFGAVGGVVEVWNLSDNSTVRTSAASESGEPVVAAATSSDGGRLAIAMASDPVRIRSVSDGSQIYHLAVLEPCRTSTLAFGHGNELLHGIITPATADHDDDAWRRNHTVSGSVGQLLV